MPNIRRRRYGSSRLSGFKNMGAARNVLLRFKRRAMRKRAAVMACILLLLLVVFTMVMCSSTNDRHDSALAQTVILEL